MTVHFKDDSVTLHHGDALNVASELLTGSVNSIVTSPPYYGLRDYGEVGQYGLEGSPAEYVEVMRTLFAELRRVLADDGTLWLNLGDSYAANSEGCRRGRGGWAQHQNAEAVVQPRTGLRPKNLLGMPWRVAFALQDDGWILRNAIVWHKVNAMPESVTDRLSSRHEMVFMFSKSRKYWFDLDAIRPPHNEKSIYQQELARRRPRDPGKSGIAVVPGSGAQSGRAAGGRELNANGRNPGDVWEIPTTPFAAAHFAVMAKEVAERCVKAGCPPRRCVTCGATPTRTKADRQLDYPGRNQDGWTDCGHMAYRPGVVLDPFSGSGTTGLAATKFGRRYVGIDLNIQYLDLSLETRLLQAGLDFGEGIA